MLVKRARLGRFLFFDTARAGSRCPQYLMKGSKKSCRKPKSKVVVNARSASIVALSRLVQKREERQRTGLFYVEGMRFVSNAVKAKFEIVQLIVSHDLLTHPFGQGLAHSLRERGIPCTQVSGALYGELSRGGTAGDRRRGAPALGNAGRDSPGDRPSLDRAGYAPLSGKSGDDPANRRRGRGGGRSPCRAGHRHL